MLIGVCALVPIWSYLHEPLYAEVGDAALKRGSSGEIDSYLAAIEEAEHSGSDSRLIASLHGLADLFCTPIS